MQRRSLMQYRAGNINSDRVVIELLPPKKRSLVMHGFGSSPTAFALHDLY